MKSKLKAITIDNNYNILKIGIAILYPFYYIQLI